jgi:hypothetical protein
VTSPTPYADLDRWLDQATQGVPRRWAASIRAELTAHFEDTTADLLQQGVPQETAHQRALAVLGDPQAVARGFNDVHRGRRHYFAAALACVLLLVENFNLPQGFLMPDWAESSASSRIFYAADHALTILLTLYVVFVIGRLLVWRFDNEAVNTPVKIVLGGLVANLIGTVILDLVRDNRTPVPTLLNATNLAEGVGSLLQDGGVLITSAGVVALGTCVLPTLNKLAKGIAVSAIFEGTAAVSYILTLYLDGRNFLYFFILIVLNTTILLPAISLVFIRAWISYRRLPTQIA